MGAQHIERFVGKGQGQQIRSMHHQGLGAGAIRRAGKGGMVTHPHRVDPIYQPGQLIQMPRVEPGGRAQRQAHPMQTHGVQRPALLQDREGSASCSEEVFGVDFQKVHSRLPLKQLRVMRMPPPYADRHLRTLQGRCWLGSLHGWSGFQTA